MQSINVKIDLRQLNLSVDDQQRERNFLLVGIITISRTVVTFTLNPAFALVSMNMIL